MSTPFLTGTAFAVRTESFAAHRMSIIWAIKTTLFVQQKQGATYSDTTKVVSRCGGTAADFLLPYLTKIAIALGVEEAGTKGTRHVVSCPVPGLDFTKTRSTAPTVRVAHQCRCWASASPRPYSSSTKQHANLRSIGFKVMSMRSEPKKRSIEYTGGNPVLTSASTESTTSSRSWQLCDQR
jgi:hypothetical protein